jgi:tetratricopeptide (TPR) repeat protein
MNMIVFARNSLRLLTLAAAVAGLSCLAQAEDTPPVQVTPVAPAAAPAPVAPVAAPAAAPASPAPAAPVEAVPAPAAPVKAEPIEAAPAPAAPVSAEPVKTEPAPAGAGKAPAIPASDADNPLPAAPAAGTEMPVVLNRQEDDPRLLAAGNEDQPSLLGSYLAGRVARNLRDQDAAAEYFDQALELDPGSDVLLEQAFVLEMSRGNWLKSEELADEVIKRGDNNRFARMVKGLQAVKRQDYAAAGAEFAKSEQRSPLGKMIGIIVEAWLDQARGEGVKALNKLHKLDPMNWARFYQDYHTAMIADQAGSFAVSDKVYQRLFEKDPRSLRMMDAYVRHFIHTGQKQKALDLIGAYRQRNGDHLLIADLEKRIKAGETLALIAVTPQDGLAELFYGIGDALTGDGGVDLGMIYLQAGLHLRPDLPLARLALAEAHESTQHYEEADQIYLGIAKDSPLWPNAAVRLAFNLNSLEKTDEAKKTLDELLVTYPEDLSALEAQGNILRAHKRYAEAVDYYSRAIALLTKPVKDDWRYFYSRGVCFERLKQWPKAEADLEKARSLDADQALVLNYLGYSWVDQGAHLANAMRLIRRAVELKPDDGYFVDSLGWAYYRLGQFDKAVEELERAVELKPDDPVINDHLGDVYWHVGRRLESQFQWSQALTLEPEPEDIPKIKEKLAKGLPEPTPAAAQVTAESQSGNAKDVTAPAPAAATPAAAAPAAAPAPTPAAGPAAVTPEPKAEAGGAPGPAKTIGAGQREHVVRNGDNLWLISKRYYGNGGHTELIKRANNLKDSGKGIKLKPGTKLIIPPLPGQ